MPSLNELLANHEDLTETVAPEHIKNATDKVRQRIRALKKLQLQTVDVEAEFYKKIHEIETEFRPRFNAINKQRAEIVNGNYEPQENEADEKLFYWMSDEEDKKFNESAPVSGGGDGAPKGIPDFWLEVLRNTPGLGETVTERDQDVLRHLIDITVEQTVEPPTFTLNFHFSENPYFKNAILTKKYTLSIGPNEFETKVLYDGPSIIATEGCTIEWLEGKNITEKVIKKIPKKGGNSGRPITKTVPHPCFFSFFAPQYTTLSKDMPDDAVEEINQDFEAGQMLRDSVIDSAVLYFTEEAVDQDEDFGEFGESDDEHTDDDE